MSGLGLPENRPALEWLATLPADWTTPRERLLLTALCLDSFDGYTCAPGRTDLMAFCGIGWVRTFDAMRDALATANDKRPALIEVDVLRGRHTRYRILRPVSDPLTTGHVSQPLTTAQSGDVSEPLTTDAGGDAADMSARVVSTSCQHELSARVVSESLTHPPSPLPTLREGEREGEALAAPPPDGGALTRPTVAEVRALITAVVPAVAAAGVDCSNTDLADALAQALAAGWDEATMTAVLADMPAPKKSPTGQVLARVRDLAGKDPAAIILPTADTTATAATADPLAEENQKAVALFCKWSGADRVALSAALAEIAAKGYTIDPTLAVDNYSQVNVDHPALGEEWQVYWETYQGVEYGEHVEHNELRARFDGLRLTEDERIRLLGFGRLEPCGSDGLYLIGDRPTVAALKRFVEVTGPMALAAAQRAAEAAPKSAKGKATPMPPPVAEVLGGDNGEPYRYPEGFGAIPPARDKVRPPGFDQAVRDADAAERQRQQAALAALAAGDTDTDMEDEW